MITITNWRKDPGTGSRRVIEMRDVFIEENPDGTVACITYTLFMPMGALSMEMKVTGNDMVYFLGKLGETYHEESNPSG